MTEADYIKLIVAIRRRDLQQSYRLFDILFDEKCKALSENNIEEYEKVSKQYDDARDIEIEEKRKEEEKKIREECRYLSDEELTYKANNSYYFEHVYKEEIERRKELKKQKIEKERKERKIEDKRIAQINRTIHFYEIMKIFTMSTDEDVDIFKLENISFNDKTYNIISYYNGFNINVSDGRSLIVRLDMEDYEIDYEDGPEKYYKRVIKIRFSNMENSLLISGFRDNSYYPHELAKDLIHQVEPSIDQKIITWDEVKEKSELLFSKEELAFIRQKVREHIAEEQQRKKDAETIKRMVLRLPTADIKKLLNSLKENK
jgi:hypothetical protein